MPRKRNAKQLKSTAYHEAGYAVAAWVLRKAYEYVTIKPDGATGSLGHLRGEELPEWAVSEIKNLDYTPTAAFFVSPKLKRYIERKVVIDYAGNAAEKIFTGRNNWSGARVDSVNAWELLSRITYGDEELKYYVKLLSTRARNLINCNWAAVEVLAAALVKWQTINSQKARRIIFGRG